MSTTLGQVRILIVDDNVPMRQMLRAMLRAAGLEHVVEAEGAIEGFDIVRRMAIDVALVDWKMKPVDGIAFTKMVRLSAECPAPYLPLLMLTAYTESSRVAAARDAGVSGFIKKPISARALLDRVGAALTDARAFVRTDAYFGPDRRRGQSASFAGPFRRQTDCDNRTSEVEIDADHGLAAAFGDTVVLDDRRFRA